MPIAARRPDPALAHVAWRDLVPMTKAAGLVECLHPLPWIALSWAAAARGAWPLAAPPAFMAFLCALRLNHEAIHGNLGFSPSGHRLVLHALSAAMLGSNHAVAFNHLRHHVTVGTANDVEGRCGRMTFARVLRYGPVFPIDMHRHAWVAGGPAVRRRMRIDLALNGVVALPAALTHAPVLVWHVAAMLTAQCLTALFAVWITHRGCDGPGPVARTQRSPLVNFAAYGMFFHWEHHLFPAVPVKRLARLAARIDAAAPHVTAGVKMVLPLLR